jgi:outer membrane protein assembly factor BamB
MIKTSILLFLGTSLSFLLIHETQADDWPQWRGPNRDGIWHETGILNSFSTPKLTPRWSVPVGSGYSGPTVADGRVYVMDRMTKPEEVERVVCFNWEDGQQLWEFSYPCRYRIEYGLGPRASVTVADDRAFSLGAMANFYCFDAKTGTVLWEKDLLTEYQARIPIWGISPSPLLYGNRVIVHVGGSDGACLIAFDVESGREVWRALDDPSSYSSPILIQQANKDVLVCWTGENVVGLNPENGKTYWSYPTKAKQMVHNICTPVFDQDRLFLSSFFDGSLLLKLHPDQFEVEKVWQKSGRNEKRTESLHSMITTPILDGDSIYGLDSYGQFRCLDANTGERIWEDQRLVPFGRWATVHLIRNGDHVWVYNENGELIICKLTPQGYEEISRTQLIEPTTEQTQREVPIHWSHPAFAYKHVFARSDRELICVDLSAK